jgi:hypothetical protein
LTLELQQDCHRGQTRYPRGDALDSGRAEEDVSRNFMYLRDSRASTLWLCVRFTKQ